MQDNQLSLRSLQTYFAQFIAGGAYFLYKYRNDRGHFLGLATWLMFSVGVVKYTERWLALQSGKLSSIRESLMMQPPLMINIHSHREDVKLKKVEGDLETLDEESIVRRAHSLFYICKSGMVGCSDDVPRKQEFMEKMQDVEWWTVVEIELSLMYDILYTKAAVIYTWHGYAIRVISPLAILTSLLLFIFREEDGQGAFDTATTYVLFVGALFMDLISLLNTLGSSWMYAYLSTTRIPWLRYTFLCSGRWDRLRHLVLSLNSFVTFGGSRSGARRWSGHIGQYNMLHFCTRPDTLLTRPLLGRLANLLNLELLWNRKHFSGATKISDPIKFYITEYAKLLYMEGRFTLGTDETKWGMTALQHHQVVYDFEGTLGDEFQEGIIIWHIGTDFFLSKCRSSNGQVLLVSAVKALSNYMMFLLVERPSVLPIIVKRMLYERACKALHQGMGRYHPTGICDMLHSLFS
uniref:Uncharacterized protein n=2 Tax=Avena sativa TaxID=4498 RepID=A0ACD5WKE3_AVESA